MGRERNVKAVLCSVKFVNGNVRYNIDKITSLCEKFCGRADVLLFGEAFLQGFDGLTWDYIKDKNIAVTWDSPEINEIRASAIKNRVAVGFGYMEKADDSIYSSFIVISETGEMLCNYRRMSIGWKIPGTDIRYKEGDTPMAFCHDGIRLGVALCGDLWTDDVAEQIGKCGADVILWPVYTDFEPDVWNSTEKLEYAERAREYCDRALLINSVCDGEGRAKGGCAYFVDGAIKCEAPAGGESLLEVEI